MIDAVPNAGKLMTKRPTLSTLPTLHGAAIAAATVLLIAAVGCARPDRAPANAGDSAKSAALSPVACPGDNGGLTLPPGFCATVFGDSIGHARHLTVAPNGDVYVNTWSSPYYGNAPVHPGGFVVALRDTSGDGRADIEVRFGTNPAAKGTGGTGIALHHGSLYVESETSIVRYALTAGQLAPGGRPETIVSGLPVSGDHQMHPFAIDSAGGLFVDLGSASNSCQSKNRTLGSPGVSPCTELLTRGGVWRYDAEKTDQPFTAAERFATGIRNAVGIAVGPGGAIYATQHGRDQLAENWPNLYTLQQGQELPSEELLVLEKGADFGWPFCYFDGAQQKLVLAPEYGGDGGKALGDCGSKRSPFAVFPAHWAPDGLLFYAGSQFPERYRQGVFVAFHGSWNRAPGPQGGYKVVFLPIADGKPGASYETFADGFAGATIEPDRAAHRPVGLAQGPDGAVYAADDQRGRVWRITYSGAGSR
jgi:glucose/arabinose dehydrogenase